MHATVSTRLNDDWFTPTAAARELLISLPSMYELIDQGELPAYRYALGAGGVIRIRAEDLASFQRRQA